MASKPVTQNLPDRHSSSSLAVHDPRTFALELTVFLPGLLCDQRLWRYQIDHLADRAAPMVADLTLDNSIEAMAIRTLAAAPPHFSLVGLSMGGYVALEIMRRAPSRVTRLALIDTSARSDTPERTEQRRAGLASLRRGRFVGITHKLLHGLLHERNVHGPVADELRSMALRVGGEAFMRQQEAIMNRPNALQTLDQIDVPTIIVVGDTDRVTPVEHSEEMQNHIASAQLHRLHKCGHMAALESPEETSSLLRGWLCLDHTQQ